MTEDYHLTTSDADLNLTVTNVVGKLEIGQRISGFKVPRSRWAIWRDRITTLRWSVPTTEPQDVKIIAIASGGGPLAIGDSVSWGSRGYVGEIMAFSDAANVALSTGGSAPLNELVRCKKPHAETSDDPK